MYQGNDIEPLLLLCSLSKSAQKARIARKFLKNGMAHVLEGLKFLSHKILELFQYNLVRIFDVTILYYGVKMVKAVNAK